MSEEAGHQSIRRRLLVLLWFVLPLTVLLVGIIKRSGTPEKRTNQPHLKLQMDAMSAWEQLPFVSITNRNDLMLYLRSVPITGERLLTEDQREKLYSTILALVNAFSLGSFQAYMEFRLPPGADYTPNESQMSVIRTHWKKGRGSDPPNDVFDLFQWWVAKQSGGDYYKGFWQRICLDAQAIYKTLGTTNYGGLPAKAGIYVSEEVQWGGFGVEAVHFTFHAGLKEYPPSFYFCDSPQSGQTPPNRKGLAVELYFFVEPSPPDPVLPIGVRYIWSSKASNWLPIDFVVGNLHMRSGREFVF
jgi:hypothetical protein